MLFRRRFFVMFFRLWFWLRFWFWLRLWFWRRFRIAAFVTSFLEDDVIA
jgi:hypothetical protein